MRTTPLPDIALLAGRSQQIRESRREPGHRQPVVAVPPDALETHLPEVTPQLPARVVSVSGNPKVSHGFFISLRRRTALLVRPAPRSSLVGLAPRCRGSL